MMALERRPRPLPPVPKKLDGEWATSSRPPTHGSNLNRFTYQYKRDVLLVDTYMQFVVLMSNSFATGSGISNDGTITISYVS